MGSQPSAATGDPVAPLLTVAGLGKFYRRRPVLHDVSLTAYPGQVVAVTVENGSGKTTLLRICAGLETADTGTIHRRAAAGYCPQEPALFDLLTPAEHLALFVGGRTAAVAEGRDLLSSLGVPLRTRTLVRDLSGGGRQKLNLGLALLGQPGLLLLDEPYQGFDHGSYLDFWQHAEAWRRQGKAVVIVTHLLTELDRARPGRRTGQPGSGWAAGMTARLTAVAAAHARILGRRRTAVLLLALLPLAFYGALSRHSPHAITVGGVASAFSAGGAAIFSMLPARAADQRLILAGYRPAVLIAGRLIVLEAAALGISLLTATVMIAGTAPPHPADVFAGVIFTGLVAVPLGLALGALLPRELEAVLVLIGIVGIQITARPDIILSDLLPFHAARQLLDGAMATPAAFWPQLAAYGAALLGISWVAWMRRAGRRPPAPATSSLAADRARATKL